MIRNSFKPQFYIDNPFDVVSEIYFYKSNQKSEFQSKLAFLQNVLV